MADGKLNIILLGKKSWSAKALDHLIDSGHQVLAVVGREPNDELDKRNGTLVGRARERGILTPTIDELYEWISEPKKSPINLNHIDLVISYLFWRRINKSLLSLPKVGAINFHPAPLPDYKGLGGYNAAILDGKNEYGVTAHFMNEEIDEGQIIKKKLFSIDKINETAYSLEMKSQTTMFELFKELIDNVEDLHELNIDETSTNGNGVYINRNQFEEMKIIRATDSNEIIERKIRAFWYPPYEGAKLKVGDEYYTLVNNNLLNDVGKVLH